MPRPERTRQITVKCPTCNAERTVNTQVAYRIRTGQTTGRCTHCRTHDHLQPSRYHSYWLTRYTITEIRELAAGLDTLLQDHSRPARPRTEHLEDAA